MSSAHPPRERFDGYETLAAPERESLLRHAFDCPECRTRLLAADPTRVFALLAVRPLPGDTLDRVSLSVSRRIDTVRPAMRRASWGAIAASLLLALALGGLVSRRPGAIVPEPVGSAGVTARALADEPDSVGEEPDTFEVLAPAGAEVYDLSVGEARIVMVFDAEIDI